MSSPRLQPEGVRDPHGWRHPVVTVSADSPVYSPLLAQCNDAPQQLHIVGDVSLLQRPAIAVVGTRNPSADGMAAAYALGRELASGGFVVVSGLARGIDGAAHQGALDAGGYTLAVMATGLDRVYPKRHTVLARKIAGQGAVISEFEVGCEPNRWHFPRRNRTISGLALATVIVEAGRPSGTLLTASAAAEQGRDVFAYPWSVYHKNGEGCRWLLAQGAQLACCARDVVLGLGGGLAAALDLSHQRQTNASGQWDMPMGDIPEKPSTPDAITTPAKAQNASVLRGSGAMSQKILGLIGDGEIDIDQLVRLTGASSEHLLVQCARLEIDGAIIATSSGYRRRIS